MAVIKSIPSQKIINGRLINSSEVAIVSDSTYVTQGEGCIVIKGVPECTVILDAKTTDHIVVKALTRVHVIPDNNKIDEEYDVLDLDLGACVEFRYCVNGWYILSSDGLKMS
jgi:hypothetical protein